MSFAINHMAAPALTATDLLGVAHAVGAVGVEFRNDLSHPLFDGMDPAEIGQVARSTGVRILAVAEVKAFNRFTAKTAGSARALIHMAKTAGAEAISLIPANDGPVDADDLRRALGEIAPLLEEADIQGYVEPLGFASSSLRRKADALDAIEAVGGQRNFRLIHDTFHHYLSGETDVFPEMTGLVHVSGVTDPAVARNHMQDKHRVLVDENDRLGNVEQLTRLREAGFCGPVSFEPFAPEVHALADPVPSLRRSMEYLQLAANQRAA